MATILPFFRAGEFETPFSPDSDGGARRPSSLAVPCLTKQPARHPEAQAGAGFAPSQATEPAQPRCSWCGAAEAEWPACTWRECKHNKPPLSAGLWCWVHGEVACRDCGAPEADIPNCRDKYCPHKEVA